MFLTVLCIQFIVKVLSEVPPVLPQNVHVDRWLMTWTPATEEKNVTYTIQYRSFDSKVWIDVPACVQITATTCNVTLTKAEDEQGCLALRVQAERRGLRSIPVEACSRHGDLCTPEVGLTARPGHLTLHLSRNHSLAKEHADHAKHRVYYGKEGEPLMKFKDAVSSVSIDGLQVGQRYCTKVQYIYFDQPVGLPSCPHCELIPETDRHSGHAWVIPAVVVVAVLIALSAGIMYVLVFHCGRIKQWLQETRYQIPEDFILETFPESHRPIATTSPSEEHCDIISSMTPLGLRE